MRTCKYLTVPAACALVLGWFATPARAYVEAAMSLGAVIAQSSHIMVVRVEKVDKQANVIVFRKVQDLKGKHPTEIIQHNIGRGGFNPREWQYPMEWAEPGKTAIFFHNGGASETCIGTYWYQAYGGGGNWGMSHGEPFLLRSFAGKPEKLASIVTEVNAGKEILVPCMVDGNKEDLHLRRARMQRLRVSLKLQDYNPKRDFAGWGGAEDFRWVAGMPGFTRFSGLPRVDAEAQAISAMDYDGDGKPDLFLVGGSKVVLVQNSGDSLNESSLPGLIGGGRAGVWADYNGDGKPDLLVASLGGPRLYTNLGGGNFRDDSQSLPREPAWNLTSAAWMDHDGDGRPDLLLGNGFHGLRLYRNQGPTGVAEPLRLGKWRYIGPFNHADRKGFETAFPPEKEIDFSKKYPGKNGEEAVWKDGTFTDGQANNLNLFKPENNTNAVVYVHREIECASPMELPVSFGSDDTLTVWLNGQQIVSQNVYRGAAPDQAVATLKLPAGKSSLLLKICQGDGDWAFFFQARSNLPPPVHWAFEDVSTQVGLGPDGLGSTVKGDTLTVCDIDGDGRPDFLYGAGSGLLVRNMPTGFVEVKDSGIACKFGRVGPVFADFDNDGAPDLFVPQNGTSKLFRNDGKGRFVDVTEKAGDLARPIGQATSAAWGDFDNDGHLDLVVGCLRSVNRFFRNKGDGTFEDATEAIGLHQRIFNTQAVCLVDLNNDGALDMVFNNEGQDSAVLLGNPEYAKKHTPVTVQVNGAAGVIGSRVRILDKQGKVQAGQFLGGGEGRGGQPAPLARFVLAPGTYRLEVRYSSGVVRAKEIIVASTHLRGVVDDQTPQVD